MIFIVTDYFDYILLASVLPSTRVILNLNGPLHDTKDTAKSTAIISLLGCRLSPDGSPHSF